MLNASKRYTSIEGAVTSSSVLSKSVPNITKEEEKGRIKIKNKIKNGQVVIFPTDKSGKLSIMTPETYSQAASVHTIKDKEVSWPMVAEVEKEMNYLSEQVVKILGMGETHNQVTRVRASTKGVDNQPPPTYFLVKDHKVVGPGCPLPTRPVCGAGEGPLARLHGLLSKPLTWFAAEMDSGAKCDSTEDMCRALQDVNTRIREEGCARP